MTEELLQDEKLERATILAVNEMVDRLEEVPKDIATRDLINLITYASKVLERREAEQDEEEAKPFDFWEQVDAMPRKRAEELVVEERDRLNAEFYRCVEWLQNSQPAS